MTLFKYKKLASEINTLKRKMSKMIKGPKYTAGQKGNQTDYAIH